MIRVEAVVLLRLDLMVKKGSWCASYCSGCRRLYLHSGLRALSCWILSVVVGSGAGLLLLPVARDSFNI